MFVPRRGATSGCLPIWRHPLAALEAAVFLDSPRLLIAPCLKIRLRALREEDAPRCFEVGASLLEVGGGAAGAFARPTAGIEAAAPLPLRRGAGVADALRDRAGVHIAVVDAPSLLC